MFERRFCGDEKIELQRLEEHLKKLRALRRFLRFESYDQRVVKKDRAELWDRPFGDNNKPGSVDDLKGIKRYNTLRGA